MSSYQFIAQRPMEKYHKVDLGFLIATLLLWGLGMFTVFTCSQSYAVRFFNGDAFYFVKRQLICSGAGLLLFIFFLFLDLLLLLFLFIISAILETLSKLTYWSSLSFLLSRKYGFSE